MSNLVADTNTAMTNSGVAVTLRLVGMAPVNYTESGNLETDLGRLVNPKDGYMDNVPGLRNTLGADVVVLLDSRAYTYYGTATFYDPATPASDQKAFIVLNQASNRNQYTLANLVGDVLGAEWQGYPF